MGTPVNWGDPLSKGLVGLWRFAEGRGEKAFDSSGRGNHGTLTGGPTWTTGDRGRALSFAGSPSFVNAPSNVPLVPPFSMSARVFPTSFATPGAIIAWQSGHFWQLGAELNEFDSSSSGTFRSIGAACALNTWSVVTWVITSSTDAAQWRCYVNGMSGVTSPNSSGVYSNADPTKMTLGRYSSLSNRYFSGLIDFILIHSRDLSNREILRLYQDPDCMLVRPKIWRGYSFQDAGRYQIAPTLFNPSALKPTSPKAIVPFFINLGSKNKPPAGVKVNRDDPIGRSIVGCWLFNEGAGNKVIDVSNNGNHGTLTNGPTWTTGDRGRALSFDGDDDYVATPAIYFGAAQQYTTWFRFMYTANGPAGDPGLFRSATDFAGSYGLWRNASSGRLWGRHNGANIATLSTGPVCSLVEWHTAAICWDGLHATIYFDGYAASSIVITSGSVWVFPGFGRQTEINLPGKIDSVLLANRALTSSEILRLHLNPNCFLDNYTASLKKVPQDRFNKESRSPIFVHP